MLIVLEHVKPEGFDFLHMAAFAVHRNSSQWKTFCKLALEADLLIERTCRLLTLVIT
jgi:hypothetical protein